MPWWAWVLVVYLLVGVLLCWWGRSTSNVKVKPLVYVVVIFGWFPITIWGALEHLIQQRKQQSK